MGTDFDWTGFRALTKRLDDLVSGSRDDDEFAQDVRRALTFIYTAGVTMPSAGDVFDAAGGEEFWNDTVDLDSELAEEAAIEKAVRALTHRIATSVQAAQQDPEIDSEELADLAETAAQGLHDTCAGLSAGSRYFDEKRFDEAAWEWSFGFDEWGSNAIAGLGALHELLWGAR
jgi:Domain of unknown function (DUF5063)